jgi:hypothetical protein
MTPRAWTDKSNHDEAKTVLIARSEWERAHALSNFLDHWLRQANEKVNLRKHQSLALLRHLLPKTFALEAVKLITPVEPGAEGEVKYTTVSGQGLEALEARVETMLRNAFKALAEKLIGAPEPKVLYEHFDADEMMKVCEPYAKFQRLASKLEVQADHPARLSTEARWAAVCRELLEAHAELFKPHEIRVCYGAAVSLE